MTVLEFPKRHVRTSRDSGDGATDGVGRNTVSGQSPAGQLSENHCSARSKRRDWMSAPASMAPSFFPSSKARELTVVSETPASSAYARATVRSSSIPAILRLSVNLPDKSTAILPNAQAAGSGHSTGMDWKPLLALIDEHLDRKGWSDHRASLEAGHVDAIRNMRRKAKGEQKGGVTFDIVFDVARVLELSPLAICKAALGYDPDADNDEIVRQQALRDAIAGLQAQLEPTPPQPKKRRPSSR